MYRTFTVHTEKDKEQPNRLCTTRKCYYLYHKQIVSIQHHILRHIDQSRDDTNHCLYNDLHTVDCSLHHTTFYHILFMAKRITHSNFYFEISYRKISVFITCLAQYTVDISHVIHFYITICIRTLCYSKIEPYIALTFI